MMTKKMNPLFKALNQTLFLSKKLIITIHNQFLPNLYIKQCIGGSYINFFLPNLIAVVFVHNVHMYMSESCPHFHYHKSESSIREWNPANPLPPYLS